MRKFVIGDIHGRVKALKQVLKDSKFNYNSDKLILLGDVVDGGSETYDVVEELLKIKKLVFVKGNHDAWFIDFIKTGWTGKIWLLQGGKNTLQSYSNNARELSDGSFIPKTHKEFFDKAVLYHEEDNMLFVHGGFDPSISIDKQKDETLLWDRELILFAKINRIPQFKKVFIGHTTTQTYGKTEPIINNNLYLLDCGAGWNGRLVMMDIESDECWMSDFQNATR